MKRKSATAQVHAAQIDVALAGAKLRHDWIPWSTHWRRHRTALLVTGGFASGAALALLPTRWWAGVGALAGRLAAVLARSSLMPALTGAAIARLRGQPAHGATPGERA